MAALLPCQPVQVRPHRMQGIEGHHGAIEVQRLQKRSEMAGLVVLDVNLEMGQETAAMLSDAEQVNPGAISAAGRNLSIPLRHWWLNSSVVSRPSRWLRGAG